MSAIGRSTGYALRMDAQAHSDEISTDESLMLAYAEGSASSFDQLYFRHKDRLYRFMYRQLSGSSAVDELFQDVWSRVIRARDEFREGAAFVTWLYSIARNRMVDHFRAESRSREIFESTDDEDEFAQINEYEPLQFAINAELAQRLKELIGDLPPPQREAFLLKEEAGLSLQDIANVSGADRETIKSRLRYAVNKLRSQLATNSD